MTTALAPSICTKAEAAALTERIREASEAVWTLLQEAHDRRAWSVLGYSSWREYASAEFGMGQSRAYQLLDQARVVNEIAEAAGSTDVEITEAAARDIKPVVKQVAQQVRQQVREVPPDKIPALVSDIVKREREKLQADRDRRRVDVVRRLFDALGVIADLPPAAEILKMIPDDRLLDADHDVHTALDYLAALSGALTASQVTLSHRLPDGTLQLIPPRV